MIIPIYRFLTMCSVRLYSNSLTISHHLLFFFSTWFKITRSSLYVHCARLTRLLRWLNHLSLHCLGVIKFLLPDSKKICLDIKFQLPYPSSLHLIIFLLYCWYQTLIFIIIPLGVMMNFEESQTLILKKDWVFMEEASWKFFPLTLILI